MFFTLRILEKIILMPKYSCNLSPIEHRTEGKTADRTSFVTSSFKYVLPLDCSYIKAQKEKTIKTI